MNGGPRATSLRPWHVRASRYVLVDRWLRARADDCVTAEGADVAPFYVLEYPDWVHVVAVSPDQQILLIRQCRPGVGAISLELPAGAIDSAEDPAMAAARELFEETGCRGASAQPVHSSPANPASHTNKIHHAYRRRRGRRRPGVRSRGEDRYALGSARRSLRRSLFG